MGVAANAVSRFLVDAYNEVKVVDILGASTRGAAFLQDANIRAPLVRQVIERDKCKSGKTYLGIPIVSEDDDWEDPDYKLVGPYWFLGEIKKREEGFLLRGGGLIVPLPKPVLITKEHPEGLDL